MSIKPPAVERIVEDVIADVAAGRLRIADAYPEAERRLADAVVSAVVFGYPDTRGEPRGLLRVKA